MSSLSPSYIAKQNPRTNFTFIFWNFIFFHSSIWLVFGVASTRRSAAAHGIDYNAFFLAGVLAMASLPSPPNLLVLLMDRDKRIFYEMLTYPIEPQRISPRQSHPSMSASPRCSRIALVVGRFSY